MTLSRQSSLSGSQKSVQTAGNTKPWTATLIFVAMEIRMMADMADLITKERTFSPRELKVCILLSLFFPQRIFCFDF